MVYFFALVMMGGLFGQQASASRRFCELLLTGQIDERLKSLGGRLVQVEFTDSSVPEFEGFVRDGDGFRVQGVSSSRREDIDYLGRIPVERVASVGIFETDVLKDLVFFRQTLQDTERVPTDDQTTRQLRLDSVNVLYLDGQGASRVLFDYRLTEVNSETRAKTFESRGRDTGTKVVTLLPRQIVEVRIPSFQKTFDGQLSLINSGYHDISTDFVHTLGIVDPTSWTGEALLARHLALQMRTARGPVLVHGIFRKIGILKDYEGTGTDRSYMVLELSAHSEKDVYRFFLDEIESVRDMNHLFNHPAYQEFVSRFEGYRELSPRERDLPSYPYSGVLYAKPRVAVLAWRSGELKVIQGELKEVQTDRYRMFTVVSGNTFHWIYEKDLVSMRVAPQ